MNTTDGMPPEARRRVQEVEERAADARTAARQVSRLRPVARRRAWAIASEIADEAVAVRARMADIDRSAPVLDPDDREFWRDPIGQERQAARKIEDPQIDALTAEAYTVDRAYDRARLDEATARWWRRGERKQARDASWNAAEAAQNANIELDLAVIDQDERDKEALQDYASDARLRAELAAEGVEEKRQREAGYPALTRWLVEQGLGTPEQEEQVELGKEVRRLAVEQAIADADRSAAEEQRRAAELDIDDELGF